jgi:hypothetical protein
MPAFAHRLDEYLQATTLTIEKDRVSAQIRLTPGVAVFPVVLASIDTNSDGLIAEAERQAYAKKVIRDLSLSIDGTGYRMRLVGMKFATTEEMRDGRGEIQLELNADVPPGGPSRRLTFENHHQSRIAAYLVNCLVPGDPKIRVTAQNRNYEQSVYQMDYLQADFSTDPLSFAWLSGASAWLGAASLLLFVRFAWLWRQRTN